MQCSQRKMVQKRLECGLLSVVQRSEPAGIALMSLWKDASTLLVREEWALVGPEGVQAQRKEKQSCGAVQWAGGCPGQDGVGGAVPSPWGSSTHLGLGSLPPAPLPAGCGRCAASAPSAKEVWENGGLFPCSISRQEGGGKKKKEFVHVSVSERAAYRNNSKTPCSSCRSSHIHLYRNMK